MIATDKEPVFFIVCMKGKVLGDVETTRVQYKIRGIPDLLERNLRLRYYENRTTFIERALKEIGMTSEPSTSFVLTLKISPEMERPVLLDELPSLLYDKHKNSTFFVAEKEQEESKPSVRMRAISSEGRPLSIRT